MTGIDQDTARAIDELVYKIRDRGDADLEVVVREFMLRLRALGWRLTAAKPAPSWKVPAGDSRTPDPAKPGSTEYLAARAQVEGDHPPDGDPYVRVIGCVRDENDGRLAVGVDYGAVTIGKRRLGSYQAAAFAQLYVDACMQAARQDGELTAANLAEYRAAAEEMYLADRGTPQHDQDSQPPAERTPPP